MAYPQGMPAKIWPDSRLIWCPVQAQTSPVPSLTRFKSYPFLAGRLLAGMTSMPRKNKTRVILHAIIAGFAASWSHKSGSAPLFAALARKFGRKILGPVIPGHAPSCLEKNGFRNA
jgi:hypothetical protein